jgi:DNA (cytosine-5)-methyltransferase 1
VSEKLKVLDLFSGIGGFSLGLERTGGFRTIAFCEIDNYCQLVLRKHWPDVFIHSDIRKLGRQHFEGWQWPDVICGGFPCQDISVANYDGKGLDGDRSGLWFEYERIIGELRPRYVIVENVANLLVRGIDRVIGGLAAIGYDAEWQVIPACAVGAHHRRNRVWIIAYPGSDGRDGRRNHRGRRPILHNLDRDAAQGQQERQGWQCWTGAVGEAVADTESDIRGTSGDEGYQSPDRSGASFANAESAVRFWRSPRATGQPALAGEVRDTASERLPDWAGGSVGQPRPLTEFERPGGREIERDFCGMAHGVRNRVDRLRALGNAIVPQIAEYIGNCILAAATADLPPESLKKEPAEAL